MDTPLKSIECTHGANLGFRDESHRSITEGMPVFGVPSVLFFIITHSLEEKNEYSHELEVYQKR